MGELSRERNARDLWVSRGHLRAMGAGVLVLACTTFALGYVVGRDTSPAPVAESSAIQEDEQLVELLARVEASARPRGGVEDLTFPDALSGRTPRVSDNLLAPESNVAVSGDPTAVEASGAPGIPVGDAAPSGAVWTLVVSEDLDAGAAVTQRDELRKAGVSAWIWYELVDGVPKHRVAVGGYPDEAAAQAAWETLELPAGIPKPKPVKR